MTREGEDSGKLCLGGCGYVGLSMDDLSPDRTLGQPPGSPTSPPEEIEKPTEGSMMGRAESSELGILTVTCLFSFV
jgi:hypothetical protein